jgi:hypothetical protein
VKVNWHLPTLSAHESEPGSLACDQAELSSC